MEEEKKHCLNCDAVINESYEYCPVCGQKTNDELTFGVLFNNTISNYFSYDARFLKSFVPLVFKPGFIAREFVKGRRLKYLHPAQYYLFVSVIFFFLFSITTRSGAEKVDSALEKGFEQGKVFEIDSIPDIKVDSMALATTLEELKKNNVAIPEEDMRVLDSIQRNGNVNMSFSDIDGVRMGAREFRKLDSLIKINAPEKEKLALFGVTDSTSTVRKFFARQGLKLYENNAQGILGAFYDTIPISMFFLIPIFALILKLLYFKRGRFAHAMVFSFYFFTFLFVVLSLIIVLNMLIDIPDWIDWLVGLSTFFYLLISLKRFYEQNYFVSFIKVSVLTFTYIMMILPFSMFIMVMVAFLLY